MDAEGSMPHPQTRVAALLAVGGGSPEILLKKRGKPPDRSVQIILGIHRQQYFVGAHTLIEPRDEVRERRLSAHALEQA